ncbi:MAG: zinc-ribbon domain-containing protein [Smithella sp.]
MYCSQCGTKNSDGVNLCEHCGNPLIKREPSALDDKPVQNPETPPSMGKRVLIIGGIILLIAGLAFFMFSSQKTGMDNGKPPVETVAPQSPVEPDVPGPPSEAVVPEYQDETVIPSSPVQPVAPQPHAEPVDKKAHDETPVPKPAAETVDAKAHDKTVDKKSADENADQKPHDETVVPKATDEADVATPPSKSPD